jgi:hypothetical protein
LVQYDDFSVHFDDFSPEGPGIELFQSDWTFQ